MYYWEYMLTPPSAEVNDNDENDDEGGIDLFREVYLRAVNTLAVNLGSAVRAAAFDRHAMPPYTAIVLVSVAWFDNHYASEAAKYYRQNEDEPQLRPLTAVDAPPQVPADTQFTAAVEQAHRCNLDRFVWTEPVLDPKFPEFLQTL